MNTQPITRDEDSRTSDEIEAQISQTRGRMDATLDELGNRLTPKSLLNSAFEWWESQPSGGGNGGLPAAAMVSLARQARLHPMPALLIGSGIVWLIADSTDDEVTSKVTSSDRSLKQNEIPMDFEESKGVIGQVVDEGSDAADSVKAKAGELGEKLHQTTDHVSQTAHAALSKGKDSLHKLKNEATEGYEAATRGFGRACDDYPLAVGVGFAALGIFIGLTLPRTRREDQWMGEQSDQIREESREKAHELLETGKAVGKNVVATVKEEAEKQGITAETMAAKVSEIADKGGEILHKAKEEALQTANDRGLTIPTANRKEDVAQIVS